MSRRPLKITLDSETLHILDLVSNKSRFIESLVKEWWIRFVNDNDLQRIAHALEVDLEKLVRVMLDQLDSDESKFYRILLMSKRLIPYSTNIWATQDGKEVRVKLVGDLVESLLDVVRQLQVHV